MAKSKLYKGFLNLSKCTDLTYLKETKKGDKGVWINIWVNDEPDDFGNTVSIQLNQTKDQRQDKLPKVYICNAKPNEPQESVSDEPKSEEDTKSVTTTVDDLPF